MYLFVLGKGTRAGQNAIDERVGDGRGDVVAPGEINPRGDTA